MRRSATLLALLLLVPAAACGGDDDDTTTDDTTTTERTAAEPTEGEPTEDEPIEDEPTETETERRSEGSSPGAVAPDVYAADVCGSIGGWYDQIDTASTALVEDATAADRQDPAAGKALVVGFLDDAIGFTEGLVADLERAGVPDTASGEETADRLVAGIEDVRTLFVDARDDTAALPTEDPEVVATGLEDIGASLQDSASAVGANFQEVLTSIEDPALSDAFETAPPCQELATAG